MNSWIFRNKLNTLRFFGYFTGIALPLFGIIHKLSGDETDPVEFRILIGIICIGLTLMSHFVKWFEDNFTGVVRFMSYIIITWFCYVLYLQSFSLNYLFGFYIILTAPCFIFVRKIHLVTYLVYSILVFSIFAFLLEDAIGSGNSIPILNKIATSATFAFIIFLFRNSNITLQNEIESTNEELTDVNENLQEKTYRLELQAREIKAQNKLLEEINIEIQQKNKNITDSIEYAKNIQQAMLPNKSTLQRLLKKHFVIFEPRDIVSGDFYWAGKVQDNLLFTVGDCTGHGVPGAFMNIVGMSMLNNIIYHHKIHSPEKILDALRDSMIERLNNTSGIHSKDGMDIALGFLNEETKELLFAGAFNSLYVVRNGQVTELKGSSMPIGEYRKITNFEIQKIALKSKDRIYIITDGLIDQYGGEDRKKYTKNRWIKLLERIQELDIEDQKRAIQSDFVNWKGDFDQIDDMTIMGIEIE